MKHRYQHDHVADATGPDDQDATHIRRLDLGGKLPSRPELDPAEQGAEAGPKCGVYEFKDLRSRNRWHEIPMKIISPSTVNIRPTVSPMVEP